jgi:hypothetical protein
MSLSAQQKMFAKDVSRLIQYVFDYGYSCTLGEAFRTPEQASLDLLHAIGIKDSLHCLRLAIDLNVFNDKGEYLTDSKYYEPFGVYWEGLSVANRWGGHFNKQLIDGNHFERRPE